MNTKRVTAAAGVIHAAQRTRQTATGIAVVLEAAGLLQSPESAAEQLALVAEVDKLRARVAELEALTPAPVQTCRTCGAGYDYGKPCGICEFKKRMATAITEDPHDSPLHRTYALGRDLPSTMTADEWNLRYPVGTPVLAYPCTRDAEPLATVTRSRAWTLGRGATALAVVSIEGASDGIRLTHVAPIGGAQ